MHVQYSLECQVNVMIVEKFKKFIHLYIYTYLSHEHEYSRYTCLCLPKLGVSRTEYGLCTCPCSKINQWVVSEFHVQGH